MSSDMGWSELMARVVVGISIAPAVIDVVPAGARVIAGAAADPCGGAAFALCCITVRESTTTETTGKNNMIHRIFMDTDLYSLWDGIIPQAGKGRHPVERYASVPRMVPFRSA